MDTVKSIFRLSYRIQGSDAMKYKLILSDVDGTLVDEKQNISENVLAKINQYQDQGGIFAIASGRIEDSVKKYCEQLNINTPCILYNGAKIVDVLNGKCIYEETLTCKQVETVFEMLPSYRVDVIIYSNNKAYIKGRNDVLDNYMKKDGIQCIEHATIRSIDPITKILLIGEGEILDDYEKRLRSSDMPMPYIVRSEPTYLEVLPCNTSKGEALIKLSEHMGIALDEIVAVGDNLNDMEMIINAGVGVAVMNAHPRLLEVADYVTATNIDDGVAKVITKVIESKL